MGNFPGEMFVSDGIRYVLKYGPNGNLRPYTVGPVASAARKAATWLPKLGWLGVGLLAVAGIAGIIYLCVSRGDEE